MEELFPMLKFSTLSSMMLNDEVSENFERHRPIPYRDLDRRHVLASHSLPDRGELHGYQHLLLTLAMAKNGESET